MIIGSPGQLPGNRVSGSRNEIVDQYFPKMVSEYEMQLAIYNNYAQANKDLKTIPNFYLKPVFLKAHQEYEMYLIKDVDFLVRLPGEYKVEYALDYKLSNLNEYPKSILSYQRFFPNYIPSNVLYIKVEP